MVKWCVISQLTSSQVDNSTVDMITWLQCDRRCHSVSFCPGRSHLRSATSAKLNFLHPKTDYESEVLLSMDQLSGTA